MDKILYSVSEAAYMLNCSTASVYKLIDKGILPYTVKGKSYLLHIDDLKAYARSKVNQYKLPYHR